MSRNGRGRGGEAYGDEDTCVEDLARGAVDGLQVADEEQGEGKDGGYEVGLGGALGVAAEDVVDAGEVLRFCQRSHEWMMDWRTYPRRGASAVVVDDLDGDDVCV